MHLSNSFSWGRVKVYNLKFLIKSSSDIYSYLLRIPFIRKKISFAYSSGEVSLPEKMIFLQPSSANKWVMSCFASYADSSSHWSNLVITTIIISLKFGTLCKQLTVFSKCWIIVSLGLSLKGIRTQIALIGCKVRASLMRRACWTGIF